MHLGRYLPRHLAIPLHRMVGAGESVVLAGPRGAGKTTLVRKEFPGHVYVTLEERSAREAAQRDAVRFLRGLRREAIVDEAQRAPGLWEAAEAVAFPAIFVSAWRVRTALPVLELYPPSRAELQRRNPLALGVLGRFEAQEMTGVAGEAGEWSLDFLEKDLPRLLQVADQDLFARYMELVAARSGAVLNQLQMAQELGVSHRTVVRWQEVLERCFQVGLVPAAREGYGRRLLRAPKLHAWWAKGCFESEVVLELYRNARHAGVDLQMAYWRDSNGLEISLLVEAEGVPQTPVLIAEGASAGMEARLGRWQALSGVRHGALITRRKVLGGRPGGGYARYTLGQL